MLILLLKSSIVIIALWAFYKAILEKESFYAVNRIYLLACLGLAIVLPFITLPKLVEHQGYLAHKIERIDQSVSPVIIEVRQENFETQNDPQSVAEKSMQATNIKQVWGLKFWIFAFYLFGVVVLLINFLAQIIKTYFKAIRNEDKIVFKDGVIVNLNTQVAPCSFFKYIFINPASYDYDTYEQIIAHEKIHVKQRHTIDLLLAELAVVFFWFNPFMWLFRKEVEKNIEYQTDELLLQADSEQKETYQINLLKIATHNKPLTITTNYNQSLIKQRIMKMNTRKSNSFSYWKYAFLAPVVLLLLLVLNEPINLIAQPAIANLDYVEQQNDDSEDREDIIYKNLNDCQGLLRAVKRQDIDKVKAFLASTNPDCTYRKDGEPRSALVAAARKGNFEIAKLIVEAGGSVEYRAKGDESPLMAASRKGNVELVQYLIQKGAEVNRAVSGDGTALISAVRGNHLDVAKVLLENGADPYQTVSGDEYAMFHARMGKKKEMVELLKQYEDKNKAN